LELEFGRTELCRPSLECHLRWNRFPTGLPPRVARVTLPAMRIPSFPTTLWSEIDRARGADGGAIGSLIERYRDPVCRYLVSKGLQPADAEDLAQEVFHRIHEKDLLKKADQSKGRFRWLILAITRNVLREHRRLWGAEKRGGAQPPLSLDDDSELGGLAAAPVEDEEFDHLWIASLLERAIRAAREEEAEKGTRYVELLQRKTGDGWSYDRIAAEHGLALSDVKNALHRGRKAISRHLWRLLEGYSSSLEEYDAEVRLVARYLKKAVSPKGTGDPE